MQAQRHNQGKPKLSFVLDAGNAIKGAADVLEFGAKKYSRNNWKKGLAMEAIIDSLLRHVEELLSGKRYDSESSLPHVDHIACNALFLADLYNDYAKSSERKSSYSDTSNLQPTFGWRWEDVRDMGGYCFKSYPPSTMAVGEGAGTKVVFC